MDLKARQEEMRLRNEKKKRRGRPPASAIQNITPKRVAGVYLLHKNGDFYIGQAADIITRFVGHVAGVVGDWPQLYLLVALENKEQRLVAERRFIAAARFIGIMLNNLLVYYEPQDVVGEEIAILKSFVAYISKLY